MLIDFDDLHANKWWLIGFGYLHHESNLGIGTEVV